MKIIIPLAGKGTRLRPHTHSKPKPLLHVAGKPLLQHIIDVCKTVEFSEMIFITGHLKDSIESFVKENYDFPCKFVEQKSMDGTAGALRLAEPYMTEDVLIVYADTMFDTDLSIIDKIRNDENIDGVMWAQEVEDYQRFGVMVVDKDNIMTKIVEKPKDPVSKLANIGMYYIKNNKLLVEGIEHVYKENIKLGSEYFLTDAFSYMISKGSRLLVTKVDAWYDCGTFDTLLETNALLLKRFNESHSKLVNSVVIAPSFIGKNVILENSVIGPNVSIADGTTVKNSVIKNSIIDEKAVVTASVLQDSTIGQCAKVKGNFKKLHVGDSSDISSD
ncbi:MAG TPA: sugar phosphate nucleotidyltransferase [Alphaproteobacteria bacterium]|nr:sugar phosphate nucleotidyltransferase [Alphaproteobacteria bacterium]